MQATKPEIKVAIIDLYAGYPNQAMRNFIDITDRYEQKHRVNISCHVFDLRGNNECPDTTFDVYITSGGPGSPIDTEGSEWENKYWALVDAIDAHNRSESSQKKHMLFVCHSFQLMCRRYELGTVNMRDSESFGIFPVYQTAGASSEFLFDGLADPFLVVDSREWQVIHPNEEKFKAMGATLMAIEQERQHIDQPRAMMAIRFNEYFFGTQFHPEADPAGMRSDMLQEDKKAEMIQEYGQQIYDDLLRDLDEPDNLLLTQNTIIPNFLHRALYSLHESPIADKSL